MHAQTLTPKNKIWIAVLPEQWYRLPDRRSGTVFSQLGYIYTLACHGWCVAAGLYVYIYIYVLEPPSVTLPDISGSILKPTLAGSSQGLCSMTNQDRLVSDDLDSSLANLVGSEYPSLVPVIYHSLYPCLSVKGCFISLFPHSYLDNGTERLRTVIYLFLY